MRKLHEIMFPSLKGKWGGIDLNECSKSFHPDWGIGENPLLKADNQIAFVADMHNRMEVDYSYGGYLENRSAMWRDLYMMKENPPKPIHLGMDFNVPAGTEVCLPFNGWVQHISKGEDQDGGWGGRMDFKCSTHSFYFIIAHLDPESIWQFHPSKQPRIWHGGYPQQHVIALVGDSGVNGGWFTHVHVQIVSEQEYESHKNPLDIDGYGVSTTLATKYLDPQQTFTAYEDFFIQKRKASESRRV